MKNNEVHYNVCCPRCGNTFTTRKGSPLWWKAKKRHEEHGYIDAYPLDPQKECGCIPEVCHPGYPYRLVGFNGWCEPFDVPFVSLGTALKVYLEMKRAGEDISLIVKRTQDGPPSRVEERLHELYGV